LLLRSSLLSSSSRPISFLVRDLYSYRSMTMSLEVCLRRSEMLPSSYLISSMRATGFTGFCGERMSSGTFWWCLLGEGGRHLWLAKMMSS
jgi:hypothetical protein